MNEQLTIIVPVHNRASLLERTLDSIADQSYRPIRLILVDNNSTDNAMQVMTDWKAANENSQLTVDIISETKPGACSARNAGLALSQTNWTMFFDSDDEMAPTHVARAMAAAQANPAAKVVGWDVVLFDGEKATVKRFATSDLLCNCIQHGTFATQRYMAQTTLFRQAGGWRDDVMVWNDIELGVRLLLLIGKDEIVKVTGRSTVAVNVSDDSITGPSYSSRAAQREHSLDCIEQELPQDKRWIVDLKRAVLAGLYKREGEAELSKQLMSKAQREPRYKYLLNFACQFTALGLPGAARLVRPFFPEP